jgi:hypothetical protein
VLRDAVEIYQRELRALTSTRRSPAEAVARMRASRSGNKLPDDITISHNVRTCVTDFVLDNSITRRWCFDSGAHEHAEKILEQLEKEQGTTLVPILWRYEVRAVLSARRTEDFWQRARRRSFSKTSRRYPSSSIRSWWTVARRRV